MPRVRKEEPKTEQPRNFDVRRIELEGRFSRKPRSFDRNISLNRPIILAPKSGMSKTEAREKLAREIAKRKRWFRTSGQIMNDGAVTFGWFVPNTYSPLKDGDWGEETAKKQEVADPNKSSRCAWRATAG